MPKEFLDWTDLFLRKSLSEDEELCKKVHSEEHDYEGDASPASAEHSSNEPRKYQGGDPRHALREQGSHGMPGSTRAGIKRSPAISMGGPKLKAPHGGISEQGLKVRGVPKYTAPTIKTEDEEDKDKENKD